MNKEKEIIIRDSEIRISQEKSHWFGIFGFILIIFGLVSFGHKNGSYAISDIFTWGSLIVGALLIVFDFARK